MVGAKTGMAEVANETKSSPKRKSRVSHWIKRGLMVGAALIAVASIVVAWMPKPVRVDVAEAQQTTMRVTVDEDGVTRVKDRFVVSAPLTGNLARVELHPGDSAKAGMVLARIVPLAPPLLDDRSRAEAAARVAAATAAKNQSLATIKRAQAALEYAKNEADRQQSLGDKGIVSPQSEQRAELELKSATETLTSARFGAKVAEHELEMAKVVLSRMRSGARGKDGEEEQFEIPSPVDGRVLKVLRESEGAVQAGTPILELGDPGALEIVVDVLTTDAVHIRPGAGVEIERWGGEQTLRGHAVVVEPSAFTRMSSLGVEEQRVNVVIELDEPREKWASLGDGYRVEARIIIWQADQVLVAPSSAVFRDKDGWAGFVVRDGVAHKTALEIGKRTGVQTQILSGLEAKDSVIVYPSDAIKDGVSVEPR